MSADTNAVFVIHAVIFTVVFVLGWSLGFIEGRKP